MHALSRALTQVEVERLPLRYPPAFTTRGWTDIQISGDQQSQAVKATAYVQPRSYRELHPRVPCVVTVHRAVGCRGDV